MSETTFAPGSRVVVRDEEWIVRSVRQTDTGGLAVSVTGLSELVRNKPAIFLDRTRLTPGVDAGNYPTRPRSEPSLPPQPPLPGESSA